MTDAPKRIWEDRMTDLTRVQLEALLDGSINDHLDYDHDTGEVYLLHQGVIAESVQPCDGPLLAAAPDLARQLLATMIERDEAQAAQALVVERAAKDARDVFSDDKTAKDAVDYMEQLIYSANRSRAPASGVETLAALRAERDTLRVLCEDRFNEIDRLAAANAVLEAKVAELEGALRNLVGPDCMYDGRNIVITAVSHGDAIRLVADARAALATQEAGNAQSTPPISPEEAQFNAVRHHERFGPLDEKGNPIDPRRRG